VKLVSCLTHQIYKKDTIKLVIQICSLFLLTKNIGFKQGQWHSTQWFQKSLDQTELIPTQPKSILEISGSAELSEILGE
jgi:hypothetical protein